MGIVLYIIYLILYTPISVVNFFVVLLIHSKSNGFFKVISDFFMESATRGDIHSNVSHRTLWNFALVKGKNYYKFGVEGETISSALGKNQLRRTLSICGWVLVYILWLIDFKYWFKGGHCVNSITN